MRAPFLDLASPDLDAFTRAVRAGMRAADRLAPDEFAAALRVFDWYAGDGRFPALDRAGAALLAAHARGDLRDRGLGLVPFLRRWLDGRVLDVDRIGGVVGNVPRSVLATIRACRALARDDGDVAALAELEAADAAFAALDHARSAVLTLIASLGHAHLDALEVCAGLHPTDAEDILDSLGVWIDLLTPPERAAVLGFTARIGEVLRDRS